MLKACDVAKYLNLSHVDLDLEFGRVTTDSRDVQPGDLFVALKGEKFDGHKFVGDVLAKGAKGVIVSEETPVPLGVAKYLVPNTLKAYQELAAAYRRSKKDLKIIGVTGSNGKTSTKDILFCCLSSKYKVVKTQANFNNEIGLPKTLFDIKDDTQMAVVEMGMRGLGQIRELCRLARPDSGVITNVGVTHLELLGSQENIAKAKSELLEGLNSNGFAVLNGDDEYVAKMGENCEAQVVYFGLKESNDYFATDIVMNGEGTDFMCTERFSGRRVNVHLPLLGMYNVYNALAAIAMGVCYGIDVAAGARAVSSAVLSARRLEIVKKAGLTFIDDSYNASPASMKGALETLTMVKEGSDSKLRCRSMAVLADMLELGEASIQAHAEIGALCKNLNLDYLFTYGDRARDIYWSAKKLGVKAQHSNNVKQAYECLNRVVRSGDVILLKGSHSMEVHRILEYFEN